MWLGDRFRNTFLQFHDNRAVSVPEHSDAGHNWLASIPKDQSINQSSALAMNGSFRLQGAAYN